MVGAMVSAQKAAKKAMESTYFGTLIVTEMQKVKDETSKLTKCDLVVTLEDCPCRLSFEKIQAVAQSNTAASVTQTIKLFISPDVVIKAGSKLTVTQDGITNDYACSGVPAVYPTHQEIMLELFKEYA